MTTPIASGRLTGYDIVNPNAHAGPPSLDGVLDDLRYEINDDGTGRVYTVTAQST